MPFVLCLEKETSDVATDFLYDYLSRRGLRVVKMSCEEHDRTTAYSLCVSQFIGRLLNGIGVKDSNIDTDNFKNLLKTKQIAMSDTFDLFKGLQLYNPFAKEMRMKVKEEMKKIEKELKRDIK